MARSAGVTTSAVVVLIGSAFCVLGGAMMVLMSAFSMYPSGAAESAGLNFHYVLAIESLVFFGFGGWGLATGIGLIRTKQWARISLLVYAVILVVFSLPLAVLMAFIHLPNTPSSGDASLPFDVATFTRVFTTLLYGAFAALGGFWLYFFNTRSVKAQFLAPQLASSEGAVAALPAGSLAGAAEALGASHPRRPLSISLIGWYLVIASALGPLFMVSFSGFYRGVKLPLLFLGFFFYGRSATVIFLAQVAAQIVAAVGLLKLKRWGLLATFGLQCLTLVNFLLVIAIPANRSKYQQVMDAMRSSVNARMNHYSSFDFPVWVGMASSLPIIVAILWFLVAERRAFSSSTEERGDGR